MKGCFIFEVFLWNKTISKTCRNHSFRDSELFSILLICDIIWKAKILFYPTTELCRFARKDHWTWLFFLYSALLDSSIFEFLDNFSHSHFVYVYFDNFIFGFGRFSQFDRNFFYRYHLFCLNRKFLFASLEAFCQDIFSHTLPSFFHRLSADLQQDSGQWLEICLPLWFLTWGWSPRKCTYTLSPGLSHLLCFLL